jgi:hypothetical protein
MISEKDALKLIQFKLESKGTKFAEYYGKTVIYIGGPKPEEFFESISDGNYTVHLLKIPYSMYNKEINQDQLNKFLES